ncbi:hypothetical protein COY07_02315 [Candidatus Peregrinibacteria bacterium CG_4_10_14_0_2_um_filter_43_11]|nr:MAG: hypothetical protein COY07_02315 [Candidatus Peregrinibacteria bacterium CG_4_10_14_0_2_um_filter_43_11]
MKLKQWLLIGFLSTMAFANVSYAKAPITGTAYAEKIGLLHFDYVTAIRPEGYEGTQNDFYAGDSAKQGSSAFTSNIYDFNDKGKCGSDYCPLTGFLWNDKIGWTILEGQQIQNALTKVDFPESDFARIQFNGRLTGYFWSEYAGWIKLSASSAGTTTGTANQTQDDWGVWVGPNPDGNGQMFHGYAWSKTLGWIKFEKGKEDTIAFGTSTDWIPDLTPPVLLAKENAWFLNESEIGTITWAELADDPESGIRNDSFITVEKEPGNNFAACNAPGMISLGFDQKLISASISMIGLIKKPPLGYCQYTLTGSIINKAGMKLTIGGTPSGDQGYSPPIHFFVRAGSYNKDKSKISFTKNNGVADGKDPITYNLALNDIAKNPIVAIDCATCPKRKITINGLFKNQMRYDSVYNTPGSPVKVNQSFLDTPGETSSLGIIPESEAYPVHITSFAPTTQNNTIEFKGFKIDIQEDEIPAVSINQKPISAKKINDLFENTGNQSLLSFEPGLIAFNGQIKTGGLTGEVIDGTPAQLEFDFKNKSINAILDSIDYDTVFEFTGSGAALLETQKIQHALSSDLVWGWLPPAPPLSGAHYENFSGEWSDSSAITELTSLFHNSYSILKNDVEPSVLEIDGSYEVDAIYDIPKNHIDRNDPTPMAIGAGSLASKQTIGFTPAFLFTPPNFNSDSLNLNIHQIITYRFPDQPQFTIYKPTANLVSGTKVKMTGVNFTGIGSGETIYDDGKNLDVVNVTGLQKLSEQMRRNVSQITLNLPSCTAGMSPLRAKGNHWTFKTSGSCVKTDENEKTVVLFYEGDSTQSLILGDGSDKTIQIPDGYRLTLILKGGLNLVIKNNIAYESEGHSFGIILLKDRGEGANIFIDSNPTNLAGMVFAEGSLMSSPNGTDYYYGENNLNSQELKNQLYWQGNIASRNTIGGTKNKIIPEGVSCGKATQYECAQRYDMDFIRRFNVSGDLAESGSRFSGGGICESDICSVGPLQTTVTLTPEGKIDKIQSKSLDAFFIEPDHRTPPPGFSVNSEQKSTEVIR